jgi:hypothetical protein
MPLFFLLFSALVEKLGDRRLNELFDGEIGRFADFQKSSELRVLKART